MVQQELLHGRAVALVSWKRDELQSTNLGERGEQNKYFPDGIDIYFENVGGEMLEAALANMNMYGRVAVCGAIAEYTDPGRRAAPGLLEVMYKRITLQGFMCYDFITKVHEFNAIIGNWIREGRIQVVEDVSSGLESVPSAFTALFRGENVGKKLVKLA